ncbi:MAG: BACON domain-containing protein [Bacteroidales bacterium]|nr:BACON domain-containing protein [Candidatus Cryptobacteroides aphodequi]
MTLKLFAHISVIFLLVSCLEDPKANDPRIFSITPAYTTVSAFAQTLDFTVSCDRGWQYSLGSTRWAKVSDLAKDRGYIAISITMNEDEADRRDTLTLRSGTLMRQAIITQKGLSSIISPLNPVLTGSETGTITITATGDWSVEVVKASRVEPWLSVEPSSGHAGTSTISLIPSDANLNVGDRSTQLRFDLGGNTISTTVTQKQTDALLPETDEIAIDYNAQEFSLTLGSNVDFAFELDCDWLHEAGTKALDSNTFRFLADANEASSAREGHIRFFSDAVSETVSVIQAGRPAFLSSSAYGIYDREGRVLREVVRGKDQTAVLSTRNACSLRMQNATTGECIALEGLPVSIKAGDRFKATVAGNMTALPHVPGSSIQFTVIKTEGRKLWLLCSDGIGYIVKK